MLFYLFVLLAGGFCLSYNGNPPSVTVLQNSVATLPCPHKMGDVTWTRFKGGTEVILVKNGKLKTSDERFVSLPDNSLQIKHVTLDDETMYLCNGSRVYLTVKPDPNMVDAGNVPVTSTISGPGSGLGPGQKGVTAAGDSDPENQQPSDSWKVAVGAVVGAALVLLGVLTFKFCSKKRRETNVAVDRTTDAEVIYEEIVDGEEQPRRESDVESPYYLAGSSETPLTNNLYSAVNKSKRSSEECVYYLAQNPPQTGSAG
ncbi:uncharacterized protein LOC127352974 isoform X3 [Dicentrarchus labrax]|uniref:uncharacterized protein LOC127352974 isoform X1 n=1 Tax=Dicentrarchus labrax TaxID=13489 RepID=UPI0021F63910|nr:uncharacterized protein LOC127352974 isoform X1 [Dicentrarchus labrax]XP_051237850.1 uncharacterized protein LOC127352974 isoform X2 [Dicentrarchus labrax]XP_051237851.1 uncharacterized protein LOC127352974 isoform X3 [Dicentrarchus labrax]